MKQIGKVGRQVHGLDDSWIFSTLEPHLISESSVTNWWAVVMLSDGRIVEKFWPVTHTMVANILYEFQRAYATDVAKFLNANCAHGGLWVVAWMDEFRRFYLCWRDVDGDIQIPIECDRSWEAIKTWDVDDWAEHAEQAYRAWCEHVKNLELSRNQQVKAAQGERGTTNGRSR